MPISSEDVAAFSRPVNPWAALKRRVNGALSELECEALAGLAERSEATCALEVGHYLGLSTCVLLESLPADCSLTTIDHHLGDEWSGARPSAFFLENIGPCRGERTFDFVEDDFRLALPNLTARFDFVFYDADHSERAVTDFWQAVQPRLADRCTLVYDDADWKDQSLLGKLAQDDGFISVRTLEFYRGKHDKKDRKTYTLEVLDRA